jgi:hypothetical protein
VAMTVLPLYPTPSFMAGGGGHRTRSDRLFFERFFPLTIPATPRSFQKTPAKKGQLGAHVREGEWGVD